MGLVGKTDFLKKYNIDAERFDQAGFVWNDLNTIYNDYCAATHYLDSIAQFMTQVLSKGPKVHSAKYRVKEPEHVIEKIIRKKIEKGREITPENFREKITDMIGVRVLHLFKEDWREIDKFIKDKFDVIEGPRVHIREGDGDQCFQLENCEIIKHKQGYRSVHYLIRTGLSKSRFIAEIQVRTIFEEGWCEIDHELKYPYVKSNAVLEKFLSILNHFAASADELGSFINFIQSEFGKNREAAMGLKSKIGHLLIDEAEKQSIKSDIDRICNLIPSEIDILAATSQCSNELPRKEREDENKIMQAVFQNAPNYAAAQDDGECKAGENVDVREPAESAKIIRSRPDDFVSIMDILNNKKNPSE